MADLNLLQIIWFVLLAVLWIGYLVLEGFDFGVGMLLRIVPKNEKERRAALNTIGPHWDGNEVWVITAGGATFAAFPEWYATMFSGMYLALVVVLLCLKMLFVMTKCAFEVLCCSRIALPSPTPQFRNTHSFTTTVTDSFLPMSALKLL